MKTFKFFSLSDNTKNVSSYYGIRIATSPTDITGYPISEAFNIPGKVRKPVFYNGQWNTVTRVYNISFPGNGQETAVYATIRSINTWLFSEGYCRLEDDFDTDVYRMARCITSIEYNQIEGRAGQAQLEFECDARKFLKSAETLTAVTKNSTLVNPGLQANPTILVTTSGAGTLTIGSYSVQISGNPGAPIKIDSEKMTITNQTGTTNYSSYISRMLDFPRLVRGSTTVTWNGSISAVSIAPNWWQP